MYDSCADMCNEKKVRNMPICVLVDREEQDRNEWQRHLLDANTYPRPHALCMCFYYTKNKSYHAVLCTMQH